jgi:hypothetical protein
MKGRMIVLVAAMVAVERLFRGLALLRGCEDPLR